MTRAADPTRHVTEFFRSPSRWPTLAAHMAEVPGVHWSGACSSGQEAWSLAITLAEGGGGGRVLASDRDPSVVSVAERGVYPAQEVLSSMPRTTAARYFDMTSDGLRVGRELRALVDFEVLEVGHDPLPSCSTALLRNMWRYLTPEVQVPAMRGVRASLDPRGLLFIGAADLVNDQLLPAEICGIAEEFRKTADPLLWKPRHHSQEKI